MENAHLVGRRLPAEPEPEDRGCFSKKPKDPFLRARRMTKWCSCPTPTHCDVHFGPCLPHKAEPCPRTCMSPLQASCCPSISSHRTATHPCCWDPLGNLPCFYRHPTPGTGEIPSRGKTLRRAGAALAELSRKGVGPGCVVRVRARRAIRMLLSSARQDQAVAQYLSQEDFSRWPPEAQG